MKKQNMIKVLIGTTTITLGLTTLQQNVYATTPNVSYNQSYLNSTYNNSDLFITLNHQDALYKYGDTIEVNITVYDPSYNSTQVALFANNIQITETVTITNNIALLTVNTKDYPEVFKPADNIELTIKNFINTTVNESKNIFIDVIKGTAPIINTPTVLNEGVYGQNLSDIQLSDTTWSWQDNSEKLMVGEFSYPITCPITDSEYYNYNMTDGFDLITKDRLIRWVKVKTDKATPIITLPNFSLTYGDNLGSLTLDTAYATGINGQLEGTFTWNDDLSLIPNVSDSNKTQYLVTFTPKDTDHYHTVTASTTININKAPSAIEVNVESRDYNGEPIEITTTQNRDGNITYEQYINNEWMTINHIPINAGLYRVTAILHENDNYLQAIDTKQFTINKIKPTVPPINDYTTLINTPITDLKLPNNFTWEDSTITLNQPGKTIQYVTYTPQDIINYEIVTHIPVNINVVLPLTSINNIPTINASDITLNLNSTFNPLDNVTAQDKEDGDLTSKIIITSNTINTSTPGTYYITYKVTDSNGASATKTVTVTVKSNEPISTPSTDETLPSVENTIPQTPTIESTIPQTNDTSINYLPLLLISLLSFLLIFKYKKD